MTSPASGISATGRVTVLRRPDSVIGNTGSAWPLLLTALLAMLAAVGCAGHVEDLAPAATPASSRPEMATPSTGADSRAVLAAYRRFWEIAQQLDRYPQDQWAARLSVVAADPLLTRVLTALRSRVQAGYRQFGTVATAATVVDLTSGHAAVLDCQDASRSGEIDTSTGQITETGQPRTPVAAALVRDPDKRWRVTEARYLDTSC
jgi:hypothetical protein